MNALCFFHALTPTTRFEIVQGDLTAENVDAIVNAANKHLANGGGVAGAIVTRGGRSIQLACDEWVQKNGVVTHANPAYTLAGKLPCRYIIHAVGPIWGEGNEDLKLQEAITGSLNLADHLELQSIAFPAISTGIFGYPKEAAAQVFMKVIPDYFRLNPDSGLTLVRLTLFDTPTLQAFLDAAKTLQA
jgi:O-acetyl-ADP-ribose deacetylase (regulator of RNase III)